MNLEINEDEKIILEVLVNRALAEIPIEIHHCKTPDFKVHLKEKQTAIERIAEKIKNLE